MYKMKLIYKNKDIKIYVLKHGSYVLSAPHLRFKGNAEQIKEIYNHIINTKRKEN